MTTRASNRKALTKALPGKGNLSPQVPSIQGKPATNGDCSPNRESGHGQKQAD